MSQSNVSNPQLPPVGWYPDPVSPGQERLWDGLRWTDQVRQSHQHHQPMIPPQPGYWQVGPEPYLPHTDFTPTFAGPRTADGVPLAGWWTRLVALVIDSILLGLVTAVVAIPFYDALMTGFEAWFADAMRAVQVGGQMPDYLDPRYGLMGPCWSVLILSMAVSFVYSAGLQMWKGGTLGMQALGLRVVPTGRGLAHHGLPLGAALVRNLAYQVLGLVPFVELINGLVPLANPRRQTLHDMAARTQVVKVR